MTAAETVHALQVRAESTMFPAEAEECCRHIARLTSRPTRNTGQTVIR